MIICFCGILRQWSPERGAINAISTKVRCQERNGEPNRERVGKDGDGKESKLTAGTRYIESHLARKSNSSLTTRKIGRDTRDNLSGEATNVTTASSAKPQEVRWTGISTSATLQETGMAGSNLLKSYDFDKSIIVILLTAHGTIGSAVDALRLGAFEYLQKPYDREKLLETVSRALKKLTTLDAEIISVSPEMDKVKKLILKIAKSNSTVLIRGESGTGKEMIARSMHTNSLRSAKHSRPLIVRRSTRTCLSPSCSGMKKVLSPVPSLIKRACLRSHTTGRFSSMK